MKLNNYVVRGDFLHFSTLICPTSLLRFPQDFWKHLFYLASNFYDLLLFSNFVVFMSWVSFWLITLTFNQVIAIIIFWFLKAAIICLQMDIIYIQERVLAISNKELEQTLKTQSKHNSVLNYFRYVLEHDTVNTL